MVDVTFQEEEYSDAIWDEFLPLMQEHRKEIAIVPDGIPFIPVKSAYEEVARVGALVIVSARAEGKAVGYIFFFLSPNLHFKDILVGHQDAMFLHPIYRKGYTGRNMIRYAEQVAKDKGASYFRQHVRVSKRDFGALLLREKYVMTDQLYEKRLL